MRDIEWQNVFYFVLTIVVLLLCFAVAGNFFKLWCVDFGIFGKTCGLTTTLR